MLEVRGRGGGTFLPHPKHFSGSKLAVKAMREVLGEGGHSWARRSPLSPKSLCKAPQGHPLHSLKGTHRG